MYRASAVRFAKNATLKGLCALNISPKPPCVEWLEYDDLIFIIFWMREWLENDIQQHTHSRHCLFHHSIAECRVLFCVLYDLYRFLDQSPTQLPGNKKLMMPSVARSRRAVSNSSTSSLKADTEHFPGAGKYSAFMPHLDIQLVCCQASRNGRTLRCACFRKHSLIEISPHMLRISHLMSLRLELSKTTSSSKNNYS